MSDVILLTGAQADQVRGPSDVTALAGLMPVALTDGRFYLPVTVLDAPLFGGARDVLAGLPTTEFSNVKPLLLVAP